MRDLVILFVHIIATLARLFGPGGILSNLSIRTTLNYIPAATPAISSG